MWEGLTGHSSLHEIMSDSGLAKIGDNILNLCYSLAKSLVTGTATGDRVKDAVLARSIRSSDLYHEIGRRTDTGRAGDAYEAVTAYLWLTGMISIETITETLAQHLSFKRGMNRKMEETTATHAFQMLLAKMNEIIPARLRRV